DLSFNISQPEAIEFEDSYSITAGDDPKDKDYLAIGWHVADPTQALDSFGLKVLEEILLGNNQSPLKKALLDANIGGDIDVGSEELCYNSSCFEYTKYSDYQKMKKYNDVLN